MTTKGMMKKKLMEQRDQLLRQVEALNNKIAGLEMAIALVDNSETAREEGVEANVRKVNVKATVLDLLEEVGTTGLNAVTAVEIAERRGMSLDKGSVSSLLSRFKRDGIVVYDNDKYRLKKFAQQPRPHMRVVSTGFGPAVSMNEADDEIPF